MCKVVFFLLIGLFLFFWGCSGLEVIPPHSHKSVITKNSYLTKSYQIYESLHFRLQGQNFLKLKEVAKIAEEIYSKVMFDTNLLSFKPKQNYLLLIYADPEDYFRETGNPLWSGGATITELAAKVLPSEREEKARTTIFLYEAGLAEWVLAHEITHLIFNEFMALSSLEEADFFRWLNEGLATYEEFSFREKKEKEEFIQAIQSSLKQFALPFERMIHFNPLKTKPGILGSYFYKGEQISFTNIDLWYWQVRSVIEFLIERQGRYNFYLFLSSLKEEKHLDTALRRAYGAMWKNLRELEEEWRQSF